MRTRLAFVVLLSPLAFAACTRRASEQTETWAWKTDMAAGSTLYLRDVTGDITVRAATGPTMEVAGTKRWTHGRSNSVRFATERQGNDVSVCAMFGDRGRCSANGFRAHSTGYHRIFGISWGSDTRANLVITLPAGVLIDASTLEGDIVVEGASAPVTAKSVNGSIKAATSVGPMTAASVNGSIDGTVGSVPKGSTLLKFFTINGDVTAVLPANLEATADLGTMTGGITSEFPLTVNGVDHGPSHARGTIGAGGTRLVMQTINGSVTLRKR